MTQTHVPFASAALLALATSALPAQIGPLPAGTFLAATYGFNGGGPSPASDSVQVVDPFARTATPLVIAGFPTRPDESPSTVLYENPWSFLLGSRVLPASIFGGPVTFGNVYRVVWSANGWTASALTPSPLGEGVAALVTIGSTIYVKTTRRFDGGNSGTSILALPSRGGSPRLVVDLTVSGAPGCGGALVARGSVLHAFTFVAWPISSAGPGEHWTIDVGVNPPLVTRIGPLPVSVRPGTGGTVHLGVHQAAWDEHMGAFAMIGTFGDVLWRRPDGTTLLHRALPGPRGGNMTDLTGAIAIDADSGAYVIGDKQAHVEELRCPHGNFHLDRTTLASSPDGVISSLAYVPGAPQYLPQTASSCADAGPEWPCSYIDRRPLPGSTVNLTLETSRSNAILLLGVSNRTWGALALPFDLNVLGAPTCMLGTSIDLAIPVSGSPLSVSLTLPPTLGPVFTQWAVPSPTNALGVVLSESRRL